MTKRFEIGQEVEIKEFTASTFHGVAGSKAVVQSISNGKYDDVITVGTDQGAFDCLPSEIYRLKASVLSESASASG